MNSTMLIVSGVVFLTLSLFAFRQVLPQEGKPPSFWTTTELRSSMTAMALLVTMIAGVGMIIKGAVS